MNAMTQPTIEYFPNSLRSIPLTAIKPSSTAIQQRRRQHFDPAKLLELADSIKAQGVLQPILVRPTNDGNAETYELVAGERRWIAADRAGLTEIDCNVRDFTDAQVIEGQLVENLQRDDVHPLEEADGYRELLGLKPMKAEDLGALIGKSRAYVYARLKLLELCPEARDALDVGALDASKALLIARFKGHKLQKQALKRLNNSPQYSYAYAVATLRDNFMIDLSKAPFALDDAAFFEMQKVAGKRHQEDCVDLPACAVCPNYSRNDAELQASFDADAHICTDRACYDTKVIAFHGRQRAAAEKEGRIVLTGEAAKAAIPDEYSGVNEQYLDLDTQCGNTLEFSEAEPEDMNSPEWDAWQLRATQWDSTTFRQLLDGALADRAVLAEGKHGKLHALLPVKDAVKLLKAKGIEIDVPHPQRSFPAADTEQMKLERAKREERQEREAELRRRVFAEIGKKWKGPLKPPDLYQIAEQMRKSNNWSQRVLVLTDIYPGAKPGNLKEAELTKVVVLLSVAGGLETYNAPGPLFALAERLKIDPSKIKKELAAEAKVKAKPSDAAPKDFKKLLDKVAPEARGKISKKAKQ